MSKDKPTGRPLRGEDADLWERVAGTTKPLRKPANRYVKRPDAAGDPDPVVAKARKTGQQTVSPCVPAAAVEPPAQPSPPPLGNYDRGEARAIASGRKDIDARIDLHGMRQREAHAALRTFIQTCQARGNRHVLVITGKGAGSKPGERGVLHREVPRWLAEPEFRASVVGFTPAHKRHGGEGALYVRLRRNRES